MQPTPSRRLVSGSATPSPPTSTPQGPVEAELARELALIQWRRRLPAYEARCADRRLQTAIASLEYYAERESQPELEERARIVMNEALLPNTEELTRLLRYEAHLDRKFTQTLRRLHRLQQTRKQEAEAEHCKTNSARRLQVPLTSVPPVPSHPPATENCKTNSAAPLRSAENLKPQNELRLRGPDASAASPKHRQ